MKRNGFVAAMFVVPLLLITGCQRSGPPTAGPTPSPSPTGPVGTASTPAPPRPTSPAPTVRSPSYPTDYPAAVLAAWARRDRQRLALLTSDPQDFLDITGNPDQHWTKVRWEGAMGSTYCSYENRAGDAIVIRISNQGLQQRQWHIAALHTWDAMTYPQEPAKYADNFVKAWIDGYKTRMRQLAVPAVVDHVLKLDTIDSNYTIETEGAAGTTYATIANPSGFRLTIKLANEPVFLRQAHAIYGFV